MEDERISKPEDQIIRNWIKANYGVKVSQFALWQLSIDDAVEYLRGLSPSLSKISKKDIESAARRN